MGPEVLESSSSDAKGAQRHSCLQRQQNAAPRTGQRGRSRPKTPDRGSTTLPTVVQRHRFIPYTNTASPAPRHSKHLPVPQAGSKGLCLTCKAQDSACPFGPQSKTMGSATATGSVQRETPGPGPTCCRGARFPSCQTPRGTCPHSDWPGRAQNLWVCSSNVNRGMSHLAQSHQAPTGAINLYNMGKEECTSQQASGAGGGVSRKGGCLLLFFFW